MKKLIFGGLFLLFLHATFASNLLETPKYSVSTHQKSSEILLSYEINRIDLDKELSALIDDKFNAGFIKEHPTAYVIISPSKDPQKLVVTIQSDGTINPAKIVVCKGGGISFVKCCNNYLDEHPRGCLKITQNNGTYYANNNC